MSVAVDPALPSVFFLKDTVIEPNKFVADFRYFDGCGVNVSLSSLSGVRTLRYHRGWWLASVTAAKHGGLWAGGRRESVLDNSGGSLGKLFGVVSCVESPPFSLLLSRLVLFSALKSPTQCCRSVCIEAPQHRPCPVDRG